MDRVRGELEPSNQQGLVWGGRGLLYTGLSNLIGTDIRPQRGWTYSQFLRGGQSKE